MWLSGFCTGESGFVRIMYRQTYGAKGRKFCSQECYIGYRFRDGSNHEGVENAGESMAAAGSESDADTNAKGEDRDDQNIRWKQIDEGDIRRYIDNPYESTYQNTVTNADPKITFLNFNLI